MTRLLLIVFLLSATPAEAVILYQDNFDSYTDMASFRAVWDVSTSGGCAPGYGPPYTLQPDTTDHFSGAQSLHSTYTGLTDGAPNFDFTTSCFANILPISLGGPLPNETVL